MEKDFPKCKRCNQACDRVRRGIIAKTVFFWLPMKRYRCYNCYRKFYVVNSKPLEFSFRKYIEAR